ncbi:MAG: asparagine synthase (glutamine-hydrolyzing), partial [Saprospiraceae bacterium]
IVFNGEIYNYKTIREQLIQQGYNFSTNSDTEVILKAFDCWSYDCVHHFRGMFAFAIWNQKTQKLLLCRDRVGVKPLYWYLKDGLFMFASELKAFHQHPNFNKTINHHAVSLFLQTGYIKSPYCIFEYAQKLLPGSFLEIDEQLQIKTWKYWDVKEIYFAALPSQNSESELISQCENLLRESFQLRMVADVPVGMFLSGGIDSSIVTALLQTQATQPLNTFTIGFENKAYNEATHAKKVAEHLGTNHTELYCTEQHFEDIIPLLPEIYDEPFGDSSGIPTYLVSKLAQQHVTVSLSADAGDEIFTGYTRYLYADQLYNKLHKIPKFAKTWASNILENISPNRLNSIVNVLPVPPKYKKNIDTRIPKLSALMTANTKLDYLYGASIFFTSEVLNSIHHASNDVTIFDKKLPLFNELNYSAYGVVDIESYLEGDILTKVDRATMRVALEGREPLIDHKIIEFAMQLPDHYKIRNGETKWILRQILYKYVPKTLIERPKMGFGIPLDNWLSTILRGELLQMTTDKNFMEAFALDQKEITRVANLYLSKRGFNLYFIWYLYCLHQWYKRWL